MSEDQLSNKEIISDYNRIYSGPGIRTNSAYYRWLARLLNFQPGTRLLDVSCGEGIFLREALKKVGRIEEFGLDISDVAIAVARKNCPQSRLMTADGQRIPFKDKQFDYVTCLGSLEHYLDPGSGIREIARVAKDDARFCIVLPNSSSIDFFLHIIREGDKPVDDFQILEKTATRKEWVALLAANGLLVERVYGSNLWPELFQEGTFKLKSVSKFIKRSLIKRICPLNLAREFIFICKKSL
ncbi:MAG: class I SAM-dependent methyltransferase [Candidatus Omnitrophica bacterium]|nr:class I SAM-dependent methyltransferase [Candidatus Omnitrophota bacterium]